MLFISHTPLIPSFLSMQHCLAGCHGDPTFAFAPALERIHSHHFPCSCPLPLLSSYPLCTVGSLFHGGGGCSSPLHLVCTGWRPPSELSHLWLDLTNCSGSAVCTGRRSCNGISLVKIVRYLISCRTYEPVNGRHCCRSIKFTLLTIQMAWCIFRPGGGMDVGLPRQEGLSLTLQ